LEGVAFVTMHARPVRRGFALLPALAALLYLLALLGWWLASTVFGDRWLWLFALNCVAIYLFLPLPLALITAALSPNLPLRLGAILGLLLFFGLYGRLLLPLPHPPAPSPAATVTVMTYNVLAHNPRPEAVADAILASDADLVALQELSPPIIAVLREQLGADYPYHLVTEGRGRHGIGVWSRYPLYATGQRLAGPWLSQPQVIEVALPTARLTLVNAHNISLDVSSPGWWTRLHQTAPARETAARALIAFARAQHGPLVVLGDFNATDQSRAYRILRTELRDAWREAGSGSGHTFPGANAHGAGPPHLGRLPLLRWMARIDYIFYSPDLQATAAWLGPWDGRSDHRPVIARLALKLDRPDAR
jgi:vancomycin resistance protein VanJ